MSSIETLYIPTLGRSDNQITYSNIPDSWKSKVIFVIQESEANFEFFKNKNTLVTPNSIGIAKTREIIAKHASKIKFGVLDDDLSFLSRINKISKIDDSSFDAMMTIFSSWLDESDVICCGMSPTWSPPLAKDFTDCTTLLCNCFLDGRKFSLETLDWTSIPISEDIHILMQLLSLGYKNRVSYLYSFDSGKLQMAGGCSSYRTLDLHNSSLLQLKKKYPKYIKLSKSFFKSGGFKNQSVLKSTYYFNKLYKDSFSKIKNYKFFN